MVPLCDKLEPNTCTLEETIPSFCVWSLVYLWPLMTCILVMCVSHARVGGSEIVVTGSKMATRQS